MNYRSKKIANERAVGRSDRGNRRRECVWQLGLARVETILRDEKVSWYTVVAKIRVHGPTPRDAKRKVLLPFPAVGNAALKAAKVCLLAIGLIPRSRRLRQDGRVRSRLLCGTCCKSCVWVDRIGRCTPHFWPYFIAGVLCALASFVGVLRSARGLASRARMCSTAEAWICETLDSTTPRMRPISFMVVSS
jgi:hypothetical protein